MIPGSSLEALAARWAARPESGVFAALAEGLAKRGDLAEAARVVAAGLARYPGHAAGLVVQAKVALAAGDRPLAVRALAVLLERDPGHPVALEMMAAARPEASVAAPQAAPPEAQEAVGAAAATDLPRPDPAPLPQPEEEVAAAVAPSAPPPAEPEGEDEAPPIITESLAALYHRQGHLEEALAAYAELAARDPSNDSVAARHEAVRRELVAQRPLPFDARESGGRSVAAWLGGVAARRPAAGRTEASFDAFYEPPPAPADATADFDAFQRWLEELAR